MRFIGKLMIILPILSGIAGYANAQNNAPNDEATTRMLKQALETDKKGVAMGLLPSSVLAIDEELIRTPANSPKARQLHKQYIAAMHADGSKAHEQLERSKAKRTMYPPARSASQPQGQQQRMCSVNNGSSTSLVPC